jgi:hypothetical protein
LTGEDNNKRRESKYVREQNTYRFAYATFSVYSPLAKKRTSVAMLTVSKPDANAGCRQGRSPPLLSASGEYISGRRRARRNA